MPKPHDTAPLNFCICQKLTPKIFTVTLMGKNLLHSQTYLTPGELRTTLPENTCSLKYLIQSKH